jgi:hypothetical protein
LVRNIGANVNSLGMQAFGLISVPMRELDDAQECQRIRLGTANVVHVRQRQGLGGRLPTAFSVTTEARKRGTLAQRLGSQRILMVAIAL